MVRFDEVDQEYQSILYSASADASVAINKLGPPQRTLLKSTLTVLDANKEYSFSPNVYGNQIRCQGNLNWHPASDQSLL
jgi:hypothetical protein